VSTLPPAFDQAIDWYARHGSGNFTEQDRQGFHRWLDADPAHGEAWNRLRTHLDQTLSPLVGTRARQALQVPRHGRRALLRGALMLGGCAIGARFMTQPGMPLADLTADLSTGTAQRRRFVLADGTTLTLDAQSAVNLDMRAEVRNVRLLHGSLLAQVPTAVQPFQLTSRFGTACLAGGECLLNQQDNHADLWIREGQASVSAMNQQQEHLTAVAGARLNALGLTRLSVTALDPGAWTRGLLEVHDQPLGQVIERLRTYHQGVLQVSDAAARLRISGVFSLDHSDQALAALNDVLPLHIEKYLGFWTRIDHA